MRERNIATSGEYFVFKPECRTFVVQHRGVEQLVARWAHNPKATGSSPVPATKLPPEAFFRGFSGGFLFPRNSVRKRIGGKDTFKLLLVIF